MWLILLLSLLTFDKNDITKRERIHFFKMFLLYPLPYIIKTLSGVKIFNGIGINQVGVPNINLKTIMLIIYFYLTFKIITFRYIYLV